MSARVFSFVAVVLGALVVLVLGHAANALAWGPGVHMATGNFILENLGLIAPHVADVLRSGRQMFLYGCLSADIFIGKGTKGKPLHSHNWTTGYQLLEQAGDERMAAYAYGYLAHLAADVVAHNHFVPRTMTVSPLAGRLSHVYVEMQADRHVAWCTRQASQLFELESREADARLMDATGNRRWPFLVKKQIYKSHLQLNELAALQRSMRFMDRALPAAGGDDQLPVMLDYATRLVLDVLNEPYLAVAMEFDPIGSRPLRQASRLRRRRLLLRNRLASRMFLLPQEITNLPVIRLDGPADGPADDQVGGDLPAPACLYIQDHAGRAN